MSDTQLPVFDSKARTRLSISLLLMRIGSAIVFFMWTIDKLLNPGHAGAVYAKFYKIAGLEETVFYVIGGLQMLLVIAFLVGFMRTWSYGILTLAHAVSTFSTYEGYLDPFAEGKHNLLFFAAIPMLAACVALWLMRRFDTYSVDGCMRQKEPAVAQSATA